MEQIRIFEPYPVERVVILGMGLSVLNWFNDIYHDPTLKDKCEVWTVNWGSLVYRHDLAFNCHNFNNPEYRKLVDVVYKGRTDPLVTLFAQEDMPFTHSFPIRQVCEEFNTNYLMNGVAYIAAFAALCHNKFGSLKMARFYGCDYNYKVPGMEHRHEEGRACVEYWMAILHYMGVSVGVGESSQLQDTCQRIQSGMYGWGHNQPQWDVKVEGETEQICFKGFADPPPMKQVEQSIEAAGGNAQ